MHTPVLLNEFLNIVQPQVGMVAIDATYGGGGHATALARAVGSEGKVFALDRDPNVARSKPPLANIVLRQGDFAQLAEFAKQEGICQADIILADLGLSSLQLDDPTRGFSFQSEGPLDMRFNITSGKTAADLLQHLAPEELERILKEHGELPATLARRLSNCISADNKGQVIATTQQLAASAHKVLAHYPWSKQESKLLAQLYQALRITVNDELNSLAQFLPQALNLLKPGGRLAVISFHSLEDRQVKRFYQQESRDCLCPPSYPVCRCGHKAELILLTRKAIKPTDTETAANPRARSARLRIAQKL